MKVESTLIEDYRAIECAIPDPHTGLRCVSNPNPRGDRVIVRGIDEEGDEVVADVIINEVEVDGFSPPHRHFESRLRYRGVGRINGIAAKAVVWFRASHLIAWFPREESRS